MTTAPGTDRERLEDVEHVLHGPEGAGRWHTLLYVLYVVALLAGIYGYTVLRGVVVVLDPPARGWRLGPGDPAGGLVLGGWPRWSSCSSCSPTSPAGDAAR
ncbi:hypothetical protein H9L10_11875 [Phycicoccus endophyticus]|uniref:Uncharacterized protein n=1 Tax=Phycicoccus endophyticus TaxID=1690220 RepID=A0A7G9R031_9MICO|nr:hypothetical protein [Phycicoccus endophyticus]QNN48956.1 hypothetical protein H9L10_11875 [Phycicoccus endophyticus]